MATMPAVSGQLAASTNDVLAVAVICFAYCGYWLAVFAALENDCVKLGLRGVERRAAVGMRHVGDREVHARPRRPPRPSRSCRV